MTDKERMMMPEPLRVPAHGATAPDTWFLPAYWPRFQVSYLQALGALRVLHEQFSPDVRCRWDDRALVFVFNLPPKEVEAFWREQYVPAPVYNPWNARSFGSGFLTSLAEARRIQHLANYCEVVDRAGASGPPEKAAAKGELSPKEKMLVDYVAGNVSHDPLHTRWSRACWQFDMEPPKKPKKTKKDEQEVGAAADLGTPGVKVRVALGTGGCAGSGDYGALFLRAAVAHFKGNGRPKKANGTTGEWSLGGFGWGDTGQWWSPLDILLLMEGALGFGYPWDDAAGFCISQPHPWHLPGAEWGYLHLPMWSGDLRWPEVERLLGAGWARPARAFGEAGAIPGVAPVGITHVGTVSWRQDGQIMRMSWDGKLRETSTLVPVELELVHSPEDEGWYANVVGGGWTLFATAPGERDKVLAAARAYINEAFGQRAVVTRTNHTVGA